MSAVQQSIQIPAADVSLEADVMVPDPARGLVLFAHGSGSSLHSPRNRLVAEELQDVVGHRSHRFAHRQRGAA
jgi:putative phosphoribosyl transferase